MQALWLSLPPFYRLALVVAVLTAVLSPWLAYAYADKYGMLYMGITLQLMGILVTLMMLIWASINTRSVLIAQTTSSLH